MGEVADHARLMPLIKESNACEDHKSHAYAAEFYQRGHPPLERTQAFERFTRAHEQQIFMHLLGARVALGRVHRASPNDDLVQLGVSVALRDRIPACG